MCLHLSAKAEACYFRLAALMYSTATMPMEKRMKTFKDEHIGSWKSKCCMLHQSDSTHWDGTLVVVVNFIHGGRYECDCNQIDFSYFFRDFTHIVLVHYLEVQVHSIHIPVTFSHICSFVVCFLVGDLSLENGLWGRGHIDIYQLCYGMTKNLLYFHELH